MAKKSKALLPKRIGKVKVGKSVRKGALADVLTSKAGQALIAEAVLAVGALAAAKLKTSRKVRGAVAVAKAKGGEAGGAADTLTYALGEAVRSFSEALHRAPADRAAAAWRRSRPRPRPSQPSPARLGRNRPFRRQPERLPRQRTPEIRTSGETSELLSLSTR